MWRVLVSVLAVLLTSCYGHVGLYYPPARTYALDFLDNARTQAPCGMARGLISTTSYIIGRIMHLARPSVRLSVFHARVPDSKTKYAKKTMLMLLFLQGWRNGRAT